jgi:hypothetical protein
VDLWQVEGQLLVALGDANPVRHHQVGPALFAVMVEALAGALRFAPQMTRISVMTETLSLS